MTIGPSGRLLSERAFAQLTKPALNNYAYGLNVRQDDGDTVIQHGGGIAGFATLLEMHERRLRHHRHRERRPRTARW